MMVLDACRNIAHRPKEEPEEGYERLAIAIVQTAVRDYRLYRRRLAHANAYDRPVIVGRLKELENFFLSEYGDILCFGKGAYILELLNQECGYHRIRLHIAKSKEYGA